MSISICIPSKDEVHVGFAKCLANLTAYLTKHNIDFDVNFLLGSVIADQRNQLVKVSKSQGHKWILWLDSDMHFPKDVAQRLLDHNLDIVAGAYSTRRQPQRSVAFTDRYNLDKRLTAKTGVHPVYAVGMGCMLTNIKVFDALPEPWFTHSWDTTTNTLTGEDIYFCKTLIDNSWEINVDADLSQELAHFGTKAFLLKETI
jgi:hypothetical protein